MDYKLFSRLPSLTTAKSELNAVIDCIETGVTSLNVMYFFFVFKKDYCFML